MDNANRNDTLANQNLQNSTNINQNTNSINSEVNSGPTIETIPDNNTITKPINLESQVEFIETLDVGPNHVTSEQQPFQDNFNAVPVPPVFEPEKNKKKLDNKKLLFFLAIGILIAGVGVGIYYFLSMAKTNAPSAKINTKEIKLELGEKLSENIDDYATISGYDKNNCTLNTKQISITKVGAYKFFITCGEQVVEGTVIVDDTTNPKVITNEVVVLPNATLKAEDFVESCIDASDCTYKFKNEEALNSALKTIGEHDIEILVSDEYNNESTITAKLIVTTDAPVRYITCESSVEDIDSIYATLLKSYKFGVSSNNKVYNITKISDFKFAELEDYLAIKNNYVESEGINGVIGKSSFNQTAQLITMKTDMTLVELNTELNLTLPDDVNTIQMYLTIYGYTCK